MMTRSDKLRATRRFCFLVLVSLSGFVPTITSAAYDCSIIYDEFESLMHKRFLLHPGEYVQTTEGQLNEFDFVTSQQGKFALYEERGDAGILLFRTGEHRYGKLLYRWSEPLPDNKRHLLILEGLYYEGVATGLIPTRFGPLRVSANMGVDLDTWQLVAVDQTLIDRRALTMQEALRLSQGETVKSDPFVDVFSSPEVVDEEVTNGETTGNGLDQDSGQDQVEPLVDETNINEREGVIETDFSLPKTDADLLVWQDEVGVYYVGATETGHANFPLESMCEPGTANMPLTPRPPVGPAP